MEIGARPSIGRCHLGLGALYRRMNKAAQAHEHLSRAMAMLREMEMTYWLERVEMETAELKKIAVRVGMKTLHQDSLLKVREGLSSIEEAIATVPPDI